MKTPNYKTSAFHGAVALGLLCGIANATALTTVPNADTNTAPAQASVSAANAAAAPATLTPTAPASSPVSPGAEDIRDIRHPRHVPQPWFWAAIAVGVATLIGAAFAFWRWLRYGKLFVMLPYEIALQGLDEAQRLMNPEHAREYCFEVSNIIRRYIEEQFQFHATQLTTEEFFRELVEVDHATLAPHRSALADFLRHCDLAKFAGWRYCRPDLEDMHDCAVEFVNQTGLTGQDRVTNKGKSNPSATCDHIPATGVQHATPI